jgi:ubiquinone/menaquinone biosynthesis C-methylase UbiE
MPTRQSGRPHAPSQASSAHRARTLLVILVLGGGLSLMLSAHSAWWWYAPLVVLAIVLAHLALLGAIVFGATRVPRGQRAPGGTTCGQEDAGHAHHGESMLLHTPRQFDMLARVLTLGRERQFRQWTLDLANVQPGHVVLDVGCGTGTLLLAAAERVGPSGAVHGIEPSTEMAVHARHKAAVHRVPLEVVAGSADRLPYPPGSFDVVFCTLVLHHLPRSMPAGAIREMRRVLRPGGRAVIVEWQRPQSFARALTSPLFLVSLLHHFGPRRAPLDVPGIASLMRALGFANITRCAFGAGGGVGAVVGYLASGTRAIAQAEPHAITHVRADA